MSRYTAEGEDAPVTGVSEY